MGPLTAFPSQQISVGEVSDGFDATENIGEPIDGYSRKTIVVPFVVGSITMVPTGCFVLYPSLCFSISTAKGASPIFPMTYRSVAIGCGKPFLMYVASCFSVTGAPASNLFSNAYCSIAPSIWRRLLMILFKVCHHVLRSLEPRCLP